MKKTIFAISAITAIAFSNSTIMAGDITYPKTRTVDVTDNYFGTAVADPYRWLENDTTAETAAWVKAQNEITDAYLAKIPFRSALKNRLTELANYEKMGMPSKHNGKYYFYKNNGLQNQSVLYVVDRLGDTPRVMLDPNTLSTDGTVALKQINFSKDGKYLAYTISRSGSDWNEIYVMDTETRQLLSDHIVWAKFTDAQWLGDGFFYSAYDAPDEEGKAFSQKNEFHKIYYHKLGTPQSADRLEFRSFEHPLRFYSAGVSDDERFVFVYESEGDGNAVYVKDLQAETPHYTCVVKSMSQHYSIIGSDNGKIFFLTDDNAPMGKVVYLNANNLKTDAFCDFIAEKDVVINSVEMADHKFIVSYLRDASTHAYLFDSNGNEVREISAPGIGTMAFACDRDEKEVFYSFSSYTVPSAIYRYDIDTDKSELYWRPNVKFNPDLYTTEQLTFASKDGTPVKMFVTYKKGLKRNGKNPVFLYGYGGFNISLNPGFSPYRVPFIENGGIMVVVNLRGGGEYGEAWHLAGTKMQKQNVFDDFIAAAEYLIAEKYTSPQYIACNGGSNGGLLVGAVVNQRPDLFAAAVPQVGVMDMLRYHTFTIGWNWAHDYGRSDDSKEMFEYLRAYSPLHSIKNDGTRYPAILVTTADHDDRVVPAHSFKYAATLQAADTGNAPKLIRIDSKAGHGSGKPISKVIDEYTDIYSFIMQNLGMRYKK